MSPRRQFEPLRTVVHLLFHEFGTAFTQLPSSWITRYYRGERKESFIVQYIQGCLALKVHGFISFLGHTNPTISNAYILHLCYR